MKFTPGYLGTSTPDITLSGDDGADLNVGNGGTLGSAAFSNVDNSPWITSFVPTLSSGTGTITSGSASCGYKQNGKVVFVRFGISIVTNGTGATNLLLTLPVTPALFYGTLGGLEYSITGKGIRALIDPAGPIARVGFASDGSYPGVNGGLYVLEGIYEAK